MSSAGPRLLDAASLLSQVADELVVRTVRDTHFAISDRVDTLTRRGTAGASTVPEVVHRGIATAVYAGLSAGFRGASAGLDRLAATGVGPGLEEGPRGRFVHAAVNGLIGDKLLRERPQLAIPIAVRHECRDVEPDRESLARAFPDATAEVVVFLHGLCESEEAWQVGRERTGTTYAEAAAARGWSPLLLRLNSGLPLRENGAALAGLMQRVVDAWPVPVRRVALVGHSMGGLVVRAAGAVVAEPPPSGDPWADLVSDVVTLGTPHLGAPIAWGVGQGSVGLGRMRETAAFGRILDLRSRGVHDLVTGLTEDVPPWPHARYHLVAATVTGARTHPVGDLLGDLLVRPRSAYGTDRRGRNLFPEASLLHVGSTGHFGLLNHPDVHRALAEWLA